MPVIYLTTIINAPQELVFDLSRSIDLHQTSMQHTNEKAVAGRMSAISEKFLNDCATITTVKTVIGDILSSYHGAKPIVINWV